MMTSLQMILVGVGVLFVVLIIAYNMWQERRYRKEASRMFSSRREDILLGESIQTDVGHGGAEAEPTPRARAVLDAPDTRVRQNADAAGAGQPVEAGRGPLPESRPGFPPAAMDLGSFRPQKSAPQHEGSPSPAPAPAGHPEPQVPPVAELQPAAASPAPAATRASAEAAAQQAAPSPFEAESPLDEEIEYVARLRFTRPVFVSYNTLMDRLRKVGKAVRAMGRRADGGWDVLAGHPSSAYESLEFGVLLADRNGALGAEQLEQYCRALYDFAAEEGGAVSCPDKRTALDKARDLDLFCVDVDVLIGLNVMARDARPFSGVEIDRLATEAGLRLGMDGAYYLEDQDGLALFSLANQEDQPFRAGGVGVDTHGLSLIFDVPRVRDGVNVFDRMTALGRQMADSLGGRLVDDNGRIVTQDSLQKDRKRLNDYFARMQARGIPAGGERALRLFA
ncbi:MAG TPA: cell division protein ZipA C-terminal FtsZ-binding domain-containing protein [Thiobacillaceae bacterium]|nr:cell division protein ZipA C-terminal FtsZ-binding domain-containing protein [Thiobacillaceae bacterium]